MIRTLIFRAGIQGLGLIRVASYLVGTRTSAQWGAGDLRWTNVQHDLPLALWSITETRFLRYGTLYDWCKTALSQPESLRFKNIIPDIALPV